MMMYICIHTDDDIIIIIIVRFICIAPFRLEMQLNKEITCNTDAHKKFCVK